MTTIRLLTGYEILDSRGRPTVQAVCQLASGAVGMASVPSGASTGQAEAVELRDGDFKRYNGLGCQKAAANISQTLNDALANHEYANQRALDQTLVALDGTPDKSRLGANTLLAVSLAFARAAAVENRVPLYAYFASLLGRSAFALPLPMVNLFSGGKHAGGQVAIQDVLVVPVAAKTMDEAMAMVFAVYQAAAQNIYKKYNMRSLTADEGGLAPSFPAPEAMIEDAVAAIETAGFKPRLEVALAVDVAASHFYDRGVYRLTDTPLHSLDVIEHLRVWLDAYPIIAIEDGLAEEDWDNWPKLAVRIGNDALVIGDDLLCTNPARIRRAIDSQAANALLLKVNQIGTLTEAAEAAQLAHTAAWRVIASARSGETEDNWLADLAIGWGAEHIKVGSISQSDRLAKYNRLLMIESDTHFPLTPYQINV
jgi:enolase 1/2/3